MNDELRTEVEELRRQLEELSGRVEALELERGAGLEGAFDSFRTRAREATRKLIDRRREG